MNTFLYNNKKKNLSCSVQKHVQIHIIHIELYYNMHVRNYRYIMKYM